ncbi:MAG: hypothetical protein KDJ35_02500 [Alphaproteobacteria bacterium]|nr:hypothetical protein [Alphaproteobacteria bacterium]
MAGPFGAGVTGNNFDITGGVSNLTVDLSEVLGAQDAETLNGDIFKGGVAFGGRHALNDPYSLVTVFGKYSAGAEYGTGELADNLRVNLLNLEAKAGVDTEFEIGRYSSLSVGASVIGQKQNYNAPNFYDGSFTNADGNKTLLRNEGVLAGADMSMNLGRFTFFGNYDFAITENTNDRMGAGIALKFGKACGNCDYGLNALVKVSQSDVNGTDAVLGNNEVVNPVDKANALNVSAGLSFKF